jgi:mono/diheme cytochrome c family protein
MKKILIAIVLVVFPLSAAALASSDLDYKTNCAACHGANVNLLPKTARLMKVDPRKLALKASAMNKGEMIAIIQKGKDKMPAFEKKLTEEQIGGIVDYIMALKKSSSTK